MTENRDKLPVNRAFREAFPDLFAPTSFSEIDEHSEEHPAADAEFLAALEAGALSEEERASFLKHIETCPSCRQELGAMIRSGFLFGDGVCDITEQPAFSANAPSAAKPSSIIRKIAFSPMLSAAVVLLVVAGVGFLSMSHLNGYMKYRKGVRIKERIESQMNAADRSFPLRAELERPTRGLVHFGASKSISIEKPFFELEGEDLEDLTELEDVLGEAVSARSDDPELALFYGQFLLYESRKTDEAVEFLSKAAETFPNQAKILLALGTAYIECGKKSKEAGHLEEALACYEQAQEKFKILNDDAGITSEYMDILDRNIKHIKKKLSESRSGGQDRD